MRHLIGVRGAVNASTVAIVAFVVFFMAKAFGFEAVTEKPVVVLVPGYFNSLAEGYEQDQADGTTVAKPYFSWTVVNTISQRGYDVEVIDQLQPVGTLDTNGKILSQELIKISQKYHNRPIWIIAHSAGGLYTLRALNESPSLPVTKVVTMATPYQGVRLVDRLGKIVPGLTTVAKFLNLESLIEFEANKVDAFLRSLKWPQNVRWYAMGTQAPGCFLFSCALAERLSWVMTVSQKIIRADSDGIVDIDSSHANDIHLPLVSWADLEYGLEHWEMVQDYRIFRIIGVRNIAWIRDQQAKMFNDVLDRLEFFK